MYHLAPHDSANSTSCKSNEIRLMNSAHKKTQPMCWENFQHNDKHN